jgi:succinyl-CoA synthetase beta subunit
MGDRFTGIVAALEALPARRLYHRAAPDAFQTQHVAASSAPTAAAASRCRWWFRLEGTNVDAARKLLQDAQKGIPTIQAATDLTDAARKVCGAVG